MILRLAFLKCNLHYFRDSINHLSVINSNLTSEVRHYLMYSYFSYALSYITDLVDIIIVSLISD